MWAQTAQHVREGGKERWELRSECVAMPLAPSYVGHYPLQQPAITLSYPSTHLTSMMMTHHDEDPPTHPPSYSLQVVTLGVDTFLQMLLRDSFMHMVGGRVSWWWPVGGWSVGGWLVGGWLAGGQLVGGRWPAQLVGGWVVGDQLVATGWLHDIRWCHACMLVMISGGATHAC